MPQSPYLRKIEKSVSSAGQPHVDLDSSYIADPHLASGTFYPLSITCDHLTKRSNISMDNNALSQTETFPNSLSSLSLNSSCDYISACNITDAYPQAT